MALDRLAPATRGGARDEPRDDERLRFVSGFADIFVTLGLVLFLGRLRAFRLVDPSAPAGSLRPVAALAWGLAEFFTRRRRMALPSIVLLVRLRAGGLRRRWPSRSRTGPRRTGGWPTLFDLADRSRLGPAAADRRRGLGDPRARAPALPALPVPITVAAGAAALCAPRPRPAVAVAPDLTRRGAQRAASSPAGLGGLRPRHALRPRRSRTRSTRRTDIAFWLHLLAAPLIVHPSSAALDARRRRRRPATLGGARPSSSASRGVALAVDRRAILVSGLVYAGLAFGTADRARRASPAAPCPLSLLALGAFILALSAGWHPLARAASCAPSPAPWQPGCRTPIGA